MTASFLHIGARSTTFNPRDYAAITLDVLDALARRCHAVPATTVRIFVPGRAECRISLGALRSELQARASREREEALGPDDIEAHGYVLFQLYTGLVEYMDAAPPVVQRVLTLNADWQRGVELLNTDSPNRATTLTQARQAFNSGVQAFYAVMAEQGFA